MRRSVLSSRFGWSRPSILGYSHLLGVDALGSLVLRCPVFQAYLIPESLSAATMKETTEIKKSPPHLLKRFAGNMEKPAGAVCLENLHLAYLIKGGSEVCFQVTPGGHLEISES